MDSQTLLGHLPPYRDEWITINEDQTVKDIVLEVLDAHQEFAPHYDNIALYFQRDTVSEVCAAIYTFCKKNLHYREETEDEQTTLLPTGILLRGGNKSVGIDCKHFSGFAGGVLDALNRSGENIKWCYRFASYRIFDDTPHHVFVVVNPGTSNEIWIDPTPRADKLTPFWQIDKKIKANTMALKRNIAGFEDIVVYEDLGKGPFWQLMPIEGASGKGDNGTNPYFTGPFLALQHYKEDPYSIQGTDWNKTTEAINAAIQTGPAPGHTFEKDFVKWIYDNSIKGWNFYYHNGVAPGYVANLPTWYPRPVVTEDLRLAFDRDYEVDDYMNDEIHALQAWVQALINEYDSTPYPVKPRDIKLFSQNNTGMPGNTSANLFNEHRGKGFFKEIGEALGNALKFVKDAVFKIVGSIPRNAFLGLVGINAFNFAGSMWNKIQGGQWDAMAKKWKSLGGNPDKLRNTIEDGKDKKAILGDAATIGEPASATALLAAAAPIVAAMLTFLDKDGKIKEVLSVTKSVLQKQFPDLDLDDYGFLDRKTGKRVEFIVDPKDDENLGGGDNQLPAPHSSTGGDLFDFLKRNPLPAAGIAAIATYFLTNKKGRKPNYLIPGGVGVAAYFVLKS